MFCICENRFVLVLSFLCNYSIFSQGISAQQVTALSVNMELNAHCHTPTFLWWKFCFFSTDWYHQLLESFPAWRYVSGTTVLRRSNGHSHLASSSKYDLYKPPQVFCQISVSDSKGPGESPLIWLVSLLTCSGRNTWTSCPFHSPPYLRGWRGTSALQVAFDGLAKALSTNLKSHHCGNVTGCSMWFVSPVLCLFYSISVYQYTVHCFCWYLTRCKLFIEIT